VLLHKTHPPTHWMTALHLHVEASTWTTPYVNDIWETYLPAHPHLLQHFGIQQVLPAALLNLISSQSKQTHVVPCPGNIRAAQAGKYIGGWIYGTEHAGVGESKSENKGGRELLYQQGSVSFLCLQGRGGWLIHSFIHVIILNLSL
jgi:hypothetical protein